MTKSEKTWNVKLQQKWLDQFPSLSYSSVLVGGICCYCVLSPQQPHKRGSLGAKPGVLVLSAYQKAYTKALGKDGIFISHENSAVHQHAAKQADLFKQTFTNPSRRVDFQLLEQKNQQEKENKQILRQIVLAVEFLAKQSLILRDHRDDKVDFVNEDINRGNFIAVLHLLAKGDDILCKHLQMVKKIEKVHQ